MKSLTFAILRGNRMAEEECLPRLLLNVERSKKGGKLFKKSGEVVAGIAELAIPFLRQSLAGNAQDVTGRQRVMKNFVPSVGWGCKEVFE